MEPPKKLSSRMLELAFLFALSAFLVRLGVSYLLEVWPDLLIGTILIIAGIIGWRVYKHKKDMGKW